MPRAGAFSVWAIALCLLSSSGGSCARKLLQGSKALDCKKVSHKDGPIRTRDSCGGERDNRSASILPSVGETREFSADSDREKRVGGVESRTTFEKTAIGGKRRLRMEFPLAKVQCVTSAFGWREETELPHSGVDLWAETGDSVYSATDGTVMSTRRGCKPGNSCVDFGNFVRVKSDGMDLVYAHLSTVDVKKGDVVTSGQRIGAVGMTGFTLGPHLHVEVIENSKSVDGCQRGLTCLACEDCTNCRKMKRMRNRR